MLADAPRLYQNLLGILRRSGGTSALWKSDRRTEFQVVAGQRRIPGPEAVVQPEKTSIAGKGRMSTL
jgi:hypothetical protein